MSTRAVIYARISLDRKEGAGVARQLADCRQLADQRGWTVVDEYVDNDVSAFRAKRRPEWDRLVSELAQYDALIAYHSDRLYRRTRDLEDLIDALEGHNVQVATVQAGDLDLSTATGRWMARQLGANARHESERIGERVARSKKARAGEGLPPGGGFRAFGYEPDKVTLHPTEAPALKKAAERVAAGGSIGAEVRRLNTEGFLTTGDKPWTVGALRRVLESPRIVGLRSYKGAIVGEAQWPAIIDEDTWKRICAMGKGRRRGRPPTDRYLLSALIACPHCGRNMYGNQINYACNPSTRGGCGKSSISITAADARVMAAVDEWLDDPRVPAWVAQGARKLDLSAEVKAIEAKQVELARRWAFDEIGTDAYDEARKTLEHRLDVLGDVSTVPASVPNVGVLRAAWRDGSVSARRAVVQALVETPIPLAPGKAEKPGERLTVTFR